MNQAKLVFIAIPLVAVVSLAACSKPDGISTVTGEGFALHVHDHSATLTRLLAINNKHQVLGVLERPGEKNPEVFEQIFFFHDGNKKHELPRLEGFTNVEALHLSDNGHVVGFASRRLGHPEGSLAGILWQPLQSKLTKLEPIKDDTAALANSISADGSRITGYSTGSNPARLRPCVWTKKGEQWVASVLPTEHSFNPFLMSGNAVISPDGKLIAASVTESISPTGIHDSSVFVWKETDGEWTGEFVCKESMRIHSVNSQGECVGELTIASGRVPYKISKSGEPIALPLLDGDTTGEAWGINDQGVVVGISDNLTAADGGPRPVRWVDGKVERLKLPEGSEFGGGYSINDSGRIAGMSDFPLPDESGEDEESSRAMGFVWMPADKTK